MVSSYPDDEILLLDELKNRPDPFSIIDVKSAVSRIVHVESINDSIQNRLDGWPSDIGKRKHSSVVVVLGEPGQGKTHITSWMRDNALSEPPGMYVVRIPPVRDVRDLERHVLRQLIEDLTHKAPGEKFVQMSYFAAQVYWAIKKMDRKQTLDQKIGMVRKKSKYQSVSSSMIKVLYKLMADDKVRLLCYDWLRGESMLPGQLVELGVSRSVDTAGLQMDALVDLTRIAPKPIVFAFDQLEGVRDLLGVDGVRHVVNFVMELYNRAEASCYLLMCQTSVWADVVDDLAKPFLDRIEDTLTLELLGPDQVVRLVSARMATVQEGLEFPYPTFPFPEEYIRYWAGKRPRSPRDVIREMKAAYSRVVHEHRLPGTKQITLEVEEEEGGLEYWLEQQVLDGVQSLSSEWDANFLQALLPIYDASRQFGSWTITQVENDRVKTGDHYTERLHMSVTGPGDERNVSIHAVAGSEPYQIFRGLTDAVRVVEEGLTDLVVLVHRADEPMDRTEIEDLKAQGRLLEAQLTPEEVATVIALGSELQDSGPLVVDGQKITNEELAAHVNQNFLPTSQIQEILASAATVVLKPVEVKEPTTESVPEPEREVPEGPALKERLVELVMNQFFVPFQDLTHELDTDLPELLHTLEQVAEFVKLEETSAGANIAYWTGEVPS